MKKRYEKANIEIIEWELEDVVTTSDELTGGELWPGDDTFIDGGDIKL